MNHQTITALRIGVSALIVLLAGCGSRAETVSRFEGVTDVRETSGGYITYKIENGTVKCREHSHRSELTCWKL